MTRFTTKRLFFSYKLRIEALLMQEEFKQTIEWLKPAIEAILITADHLKDSQPLKEILYAILLAGNFLNSVSARTGSYIFELLD